MIIGIDGNEANCEQKVGIHVYAFNCLWGLYELNQKLTKKHQFIIYLKNTAHNDLPKASKFWQYKILSGRKFWIISALVPYLWRNPEKIDFFFTPSHYIPPFVNIPRVCSIMDLGYLKSREQFRGYDYWQLRLWTAYSMSRSKYVIAISYATERDIVRRFPFSKKKIFVTHLGYDHKKFNSSVKYSKNFNTLEGFSLPTKYILYLGTLKPSKNIEGIVRAWAMIREQFPKYKLVITGKRGWLYEKIFRLIEELNLEREVIFTDFISDASKPALIAGSKLFLLPSFWEGFGLDILSSMAVGVPVLVSKVGSPPEVAGKAGVYVDPYSIDDIAAKIKKVLLMPKKDYNKLVKAGIEQVKKFSWEKTAEETLRVLRLAAR